VTATLVHASCVAVEGRAVLIGGASGRGKSDLAFRLIDRGARLVSDDCTLVTPAEGRLTAAAPATISGRIELRGVGILSLEPVSGVPVCLYVDLDRAPERLPEPATRILAGVPLPDIALAALEASAPLKLEAALRLHGLPLT
jgi:serine kinase of HPr protein (carbohydrate metabolism regulator)